MGITIKRYSCKLTYEDAATLDEFWELVKRTERSLDREQQRHWDGRECGEHIIAAQGVLPYGATPEELVCQQETLDEILAVLPSAPRPSGSGSCSIRLRFQLCGDWSDVWLFQGRSPREHRGCSEKVFQIFPMTALTPPRHDGYQVRGNRPITVRDKLFQQLVPPMPRRSQ